MKKIFAVLIIIALLVMFLGCTETNEDEIETNEDTINEEDNNQIDPIVSDEIENSTINEDEELDVGEMI
jgi:uncharacterized membrane protein YvbJ